MIQKDSTAVAVRCQGIVKVRQFKMDKAAAIPHGRELNTVLTIQLCVYGFKHLQQGKCPLVIANISVNLRKSPEKITVRIAVEVAPEDIVQRPAELDQCFLLCIIIRRCILHINSDLPDKGLAGVVQDGLTLCADCGGDHRVDGIKILRSPCCIDCLLLDPSAFGKVVQIGTVFQREPISKYPGNELQFSSILIQVCCTGPPKHMKFLCIFHT